MLNDFRFALRMITGHRWFSAAVIVTLALGIGINTTVFTLVNSVLFKPVPIPGGERLVTVMNRDRKEPDRNSGISWADYLTYKQESRAFEGLEAIVFEESVFSEPNNPPERIRGARTTTAIFNLVHTPPVLGRGFTEADGLPGAETFVLIGSRVWHRRYGGDPGIIGRALRLNGKPATIIGVMPEGFRFPDNEDFWRPLVPDEDLEKRTTRRVTLFGLLKPGTTVEEANADLRVISGRLTEEFPDSNKNFEATVRTFHDTYNGGPIRSVFYMMLGAVAFVLLIACANVANMMLSRAIARSREVAVRTAMGASRWKIVRQMLVESMVLSLLGGLLGLAVAALGVHAFDMATQDVGRPYWILFDMDWRAFSYFAAISVLSGIAFGIIPAVRASRVNLNAAMKEGSLGTGSNRGTLAGALVILQFALTVVLLAGAGAMMRSFFAVQAVNPFVRAETILTARIQLPDGKGELYETPLARTQFYEKLLPKLRTLPGVTEVAIVNHLPGLGAGDRKLEFEDRENPDPKNPPQGSMLVETPNYLGAVGLPLFQGRDFSETDGEEGREVAIVSRSFAAKYWPEGDVIGRRFRNFDNEKPGPWMQVVGICADLVQDLKDAEKSPVYHVPYRQQSWAWMGLMVRTSVDPATLAGPVRAAVQEVDQDLPLYDVLTLTAAMERGRWFLVVFGALFLSFALTGLLMASVGIYAVVAQATARRTREIGIRMALGATGARIAQLVLSRGLLQLGIGLVIGLGGAFGATHLMQQSGLVLRVSANDPVLFFAITGILVAIGLFACWLPARRAARIAPTEALRTE